MAKAKKATKTKKAAKKASKSGAKKAPAKKAVKKTARGGAKPSKARKPAKKPAKKAAVKRAPVAPPPMDTESTPITAETPVDTDAAEGNVPAPDDLGETDQGWDDQEAAS
jgi:hypothetical protein